METLQWPKWNHGYATVNGLRLHYVHAGTGPLVILLHGFPEFWYAWRRQIPAIADAGFHVVAPDMRGYNTSDKPSGIRSYAMPNLVADVIALTQSFGQNRFHLVGHDWGGAVAWATAMACPNAVDRLAILNAPHPSALLRELSTWDQRRRSLYMLGFQLPWLPEKAVRHDDFAALRDVFRNDPANPGAFSEGDIRRYIQALAQPRALTAALNYYRALRLTPPRKVRETVRRVDTPTLLLWGDRDRYLNMATAKGLEEWAPNLETIHFPEASHWLQADEPDAVNRHIIEFLQR